MPQNTHNFNKCRGNTDREERNALQMISTCLFGQAQVKGLTTLLYYILQNILIVIKYQWPDEKKNIVHIHFLDNYLPQSFFHSWTWDLWGCSAVHCQYKNVFSLQVVKHSNKNNSKEQFNFIQCEIKMLIGQVKKEGSKGGFHPMYIQNNVS